MNLSTLRERLRPPGASTSVLLLALAIIAAIWWSFGTRFIDRVIPYYDSLSYQEGYRHAAMETAESGALSSFATTWLQQGNNVVLYKLFASLASGLIPSSREGLFVYLFLIHFAAAAALFAAVSRLAGAAAPAFLAIAVLCALAPFGMLRDGVGDQRMDLSSGSFYLLFTSLGLLWLTKPSVTTAFLTGLSAAFAALHRPIMVPSIAVLGIVFLAIAIVRHKQSRRAWTWQSVAALGPVLLLDVPWFIRHYESLRYYYFEFNYDVGNVDSFTAALKFNLAVYWSAFGWTPLALLVGGLALFRASGARFNWARIALIALAWAIPLAVLVGSKSTANYYVQQVCLSIPALLLGAVTCSESKRRLPQTVAAVALAAVIIALPFRLNRSLARELPRPREEVDAVSRQIAAVNPTAHLTSFHDLPANAVAITSVAHQLGLQLEAGYTAYYPTQFGLTNEFRDDVTSDAVRAQVLNTLAKSKSTDQLLLLPTADTTFRLWAGLYSHRLLPMIREEVERDSAFERVTRVGPIQEVYFDLYRIK